MNIDISSIQDKTEKIAFSLFRTWTINAKKDYPQLDFTIRDESILKKDFENSIIDSIKALHKKENDKYQGWKIGFVLGFIQSNLNSHWIFEYIRKQEEKYQHITMLQAMRDYLKFDKPVMQRIEKIYRYLLNSKSNIASLDPEIVASYEGMITNLLTGKDIQKNNSIILTFFNNVITEMINTFMESETSIYLPDMDTVFTNNEILELLKINGLANR